MAGTNSVVAELDSLISKLRGERREHEAAIAGIDAIAAKYGINLAGGRIGRPKGTPGPKKGKRTRGVFERTGEESVLDFVKKHGSPTAKEVNTHWAKEGRKGKADNTLSRLASSKHLKRVTIKGQRGAQYAIA